MKRRKTIRGIKKLGLVAIIVGAVIATYPLLTNFYAWYGSEERIQEAAKPGAGTGEVGAAEGEFSEAALEIPAVGLSALVVKGTSQKELARAVGWYEESALPGKGNTAIAGHRTMYGGPFRNLHHLGFGDEVILSYQGETYRYQVEEVFTVASTDWSVIEPTDYPALTLTTCYPGDITKRRVVRAVFVPEDEL